MARQPGTAPRLNSSSKGTKKEVEAPKRQLPKTKAVVNRHSQNLAAKKLLLCLQRTNRTTGGSLDPRQFLCAYFAYARVVEGLKGLIPLGVTGTDTGPCSGCPICANTPGVC